MVVNYNDNADFHRRWNVSIGPAEQAGRPTSGAAKIASIIRMAAILIMLF